MKVEYANATQELVDNAIDQAGFDGRRIKRILLDSAERHALYQTGDVEKEHYIRGTRRYRSTLRGTYRGIPIHAEEEC